MLLLPSVCFAESLIQKAEKTIDMMACLAKRTSTMCIIEGSLRESHSEQVESLTAIYGQSKKYYLVTKSSNWLKMWPNQQRKEDLVLYHKDALGFIEGNVKESENKNIKRSAKKELEEIINKLGAEPQIIEIEFEPWKENGIIYQICYNTNKKTVECMTSAAANIATGHVTLFSIASDENSMIESVIQIIASLETVKEEQELIQ